MLLLPSPGVIIMSDPKPGPKGSVDNAGGDDSVKCLGGGVSTREDNGVVERRMLGLDALIDLQAIHRVLPRRHPEGR